MTKTDLNSLLCCFCFDRKSAIFVICSLAIFHSFVNVALSTKVLLEDSPQHVYVIAIVVRIIDGTQHLKTLYLLFNQVKLALFILHILSSLSLLTSLHFYKKGLRLMTNIFVTTELCGLIYTVAECLFTTIQLDDSMSRALVAVTMFITSFFMFWCTLIILTYTKGFYTSAADASIMNYINEKNLVAYYKGVEDLPKSFI